MSKQLELMFVLHVKGNIVAIFGVDGLGHLAIQFASKLLIQLVLMVLIMVLER
jgi:D-arabinose 1-dehydrogenase-like Zn-dependent alcohol dehydrogenase